MREFDLIRQLAERLTPVRCDTVLGIGDDAALLAPPIGDELAVTTDTLISGRHFPSDTPAFDIGYKAMAVNLSDLAAMGAEPAWVTLALAAPELDEIWCRDLLDGAQAAVGQASVDIVGGDTTRSEVLTLSVTAIGLCPPGQAIRRSGARAGDLIAVTGTLGDAAAGLAQWASRPHAPASPAAFAVSRLCRPAWRRGIAMRGQAHAAVDISDGLCADLCHILSASGVGARLHVDALPCSSALADLVPDSAARQRLQLTGGDDYELCMTIPRARLGAVADAIGCPLTVIGDVCAEAGLTLVGADNQVLAPESIDLAGWDHFA